MPGSGRWRRGEIPPAAHPFRFATSAEAQQSLALIDAGLPNATSGGLMVEAADGWWEPAFDPAYYPAIVSDDRSSAGDLLAELRDVRAATAS